MRGERQIDIDQGIGARKSLPRRGIIAEAVDDPLLPAQQIGMCSQILLMGNTAAPGSKFDQIEREEWQPRQLGQPSGKRGFPTTSVPEYSDPLHLPNAVDGLDSRSSLTK